MRYLLLFLCFINISFALDVSIYSNSIKINSTDIAKVLNTQSSDYYRSIEIYTEKDEQILEKVLDEIESYQGQGAEGFYNNENDFKSSFINSSKKIAVTKLYKAKVIISINDDGSSTKVRIFYKGGSYEREYLPQNSIDIIVSNTLSILKKLGVFDTLDDGVL